MLNYIATRKDPYSLGLFDDFFFPRKENSLLKVDVKETKDSYKMKVNVPEIKKENVNLSLEDGYLTISVKQDEEKDNEEEGYIYHERYFGSASRTFYLGKGYSNEDIKAEMKDGVLHLEFPKEKEIEKKEDKYITIK